MNELFNSFVILFIVIDPLGVAAIFAALSMRTDRRLQRKMAFVGTATATGILIVFYLLGDWLLKTLGISISAFRIAGGILLFLLAIDMVFARQSGLRSTTDREQHEAENRLDLSIFPLAFPLLAGPGAMTTVLLMASMADTPAISISLFAVLISVMLITLVALLFAPAIMRAVGETGANAINRMLGLILSALAVQYVLDGITSAWAQ